MKTSFTFTLSILLFSSSCQSAPRVQAEEALQGNEFWSLDVGGSKKDSLFHLLERPDGSFLALGKSESSDGGIGVNPERGQDAWMLELDARGKVSKSILWGGYNQDLFTHGANTKDGGFVVVGSTSSNDGEAPFRSDQRSDSDILLRKFNSKGTIEWEKTYGGSFDDLGLYVLALNDGGFLLGADSYSTDGLGSHPNPQWAHHGCPGGHRDFLVVRLDSRGSVLWHRSFGGTNHEYLSQMVETSDGAFAAVGRTESSDGNVTGFRGEYDGWVVKFSPSGELLWERVVGGEMWDWGSNIAASPNGGVLFSGYSFSWDGDGEGNRGDYDYQLVRFDGQGRRLWSRMYGGPKDDFAQGMVALPDGTYLVTGGSVAAGNDVSEIRGSFDLWVIRVNDKGQLLWSQTFGGSAYDISSPGGSDYYMAGPGTALSLTADGGVAMAGASRSSDGDLGGNQGGYDAWLMRFYPQIWKDGSSGKRGQINPLQPKDPSREPSLRSAPAVKWARSFGGSKKDAPLDSPQALINDGAGGFTFVGTSESSDHGLRHRGAGDVWIVNTDGQGKMNWQRTYGGSKRETGAALTKVEGGYVFVATSESKDGMVGANKGGADLWVVKIDEKGKILWKRVLGGSAEEVASTIVSTRDGGVLVGGSSFSKDQDVTDHICGFDYWVVKFSANGERQWSKSIGGSSNDYLIQAIEDKEGGFALIGRSESKDKAAEGNHGMYDYLFVRLDAQGKEVFQRTYGALDWEWGNSVALTSDGGFILNGYTYTFDDFENGQVKCNHGEMDFWVAKLSKVGELEWQQCLGGSNYDLGYGIIQAKDGGYLAVGGTASSDGQISSKKGGWDGWVAKLSVRGELLWEKSFGGSGYDVAYALVEDPQGGVVALAESFSADGDMVENKGEEDALLVKIGPDNQW
jgi:hypothetical protein